MGLDLAALHRKRNYPQFAK